MRRALALLCLFSPTLFAALPIDQQTLIGWQQKEKPPLLLDVRTAEEFAAGHIPGARNLSSAELNERMGELKGFEQKPVVIYCRSGRRASEVITRLEKAGFNQLYHLSGDWQGWVKGKRPIKMAD
ncbi:rhodanese-like domain-containing protein [Aeromonas diversa]|uniref:Phage shock protein E n=1 Tax=Aeromonas diversa CDC 2478-85 TaxID=1268237 RepID=N9V993_9GAMM|nr:rhodanese-like domain-containing protein [Aeromonas diversa]ENY71847.1 phage shock protein E [Aeromonas diversa CDC 2478-85]